MIAMDQKKTTKAALYVRVSTLLGQSVDNQLIPLREFASQRGFDVFKEYSDEGVSGSRERRPGLDEMLKDAQLGKFKVLIVTALDRCSRSTKHMLTLVDELKHYGVHLISLREQLDFTTPTGQMALTVLAAVATLERQITAERIKATLAAKKIQAERTGNGWRVGRAPLAPEIAEEIRSLRKRGYSIRGIERKLGKKASKATICRVLKKKGA